MTVAGQAVFCCCSGLARPRRANANSLPKSYVISAGACGATGPVKEISVTGAEEVVDAVQVIARISSAVAMAPAFDLIAIDYPGGNAFCDIIERKRLIFYDKLFMSGLLTLGPNEWSPLAVVAHEVGHHICGHSLLNDGSRPPRELEADHFAGFVLGMMGASAIEAVAFWEALDPTVVSNTHPPRDERLATAKSGWEVAAGRKIGEERHSLVSANKNDRGTYDRITSTFEKKEQSWEEWQHGKYLVSFAEIYRDPRSIYLYDARRDMTVRLDISRAGGIASGYWREGKVVDRSLYWSPLDPAFWPTGMRSSDEIRD